MNALEGQDLRCCYQKEPLAVQAERVSFAWQVGGHSGAAVQAGYELQVHRAAMPGRSRPAELVWASGLRRGVECAGIAYEGPALEEGSAYAWRVRLWDAAEGFGEWSHEARFETGPGPCWPAVWVGRGRWDERFDPPAGEGPVDAVRNALRPAVYLRTRFEVKAAPAFARLYVTALGLYEARLNGAKVGDAVLAPGWTDYRQRVAFQSYDVTGMLVEGANVVGAVVGEGWYSGFYGFDAKRAGAHYGTEPMLMAMLVVGYDDGTAQVCATDQGWVGRTGAVRHADLLMGERQDLRLEPAGWDRPGEGPEGWWPVRTWEGGAVPLVADQGPPVRVTEDLRPVSVVAAAPGRYVVDFGQNIAGWVRLEAPGGREGCEVTVRHAEVLDEGGDLYTHNLRTARAVDEYVLAGQAAALEPHFTFHGFRYAEVSGWPGELRPQDVVARALHSDIARTGEVRCSEPAVEGLLRNVDWGQRGNFISVPTDCPQRDERLGWLGDAQIFARTAAYNRDVAGFYTKWVDDVIDAQLPSGAFTDIAPRMHLEWGGAPAWGDAGVIVPWTVYKMYGDSAIVAHCFAAMQRWMEYLGKGNPSYLRNRGLGNNYGDWLAPHGDSTPRELLATAYWAYDAELMAEMAQVLGRGADAGAYRELAATVRRAFQREFVDEVGRVASGTQTAYALALHLRLLPEGLRPAAANLLAEEVRARGCRLTTGFVGVGYLLPALSEHGYTELAYALLLQRSFPSWRYAMERGATTIWERWDGWTEERGFQSPQMNSFNHYALGSVAEWVYRFMVGIDMAPGAVGFGQLQLRPHPGGGLSYAEGVYRSARGPIASGWRLGGGGITVEVALPPGSTGTVHVVSADPAAARDRDGRLPDEVGRFPGALGVGEAVFRVGPGRHEFSAVAPPMDGVGTA